MKTLLAAAALAAASLGAAAAPSDPVKVVYHMNEDVDRAPQALRNVGNHLSVDPKAKIVFVSHAAGINFLMKDAKGATIPAWFIQNVTATHNGKTVLSAEWGPAVAKNPFLSFRFAGGKPGDKVVITWTDNKGDKRTDEATIA